MFLGQGGRMVIRAAYFVVIARALGADGYGAFIGVTALVAIASPFSSWGSGDLLIRTVSRNPERFGTSWGNALLVTLVSGAALIGLILAIARAVLPDSIPLQLISVVALADLFAARVVDIGAQAYQAFERLDRTAVFRALPNLARLLGASAMVLVVPEATALQWGWVYLLTTLLTCSFTIAVVGQELGRPTFRPSEAFRDWKEGFFFAVSESSQNIYNDIDKTMLARLATLEAAGIYAAAYRLLEVAFAPVRSILYASYARFFKVGTDGIRGSVRFARKLLPVGWAFSLGGGLLLIIFAPIAPTILGDDYQNSAEAIRWLSVLPFLKTGHYFAADSLTGAGYQGLRSAIQILVAIINVMLNLWLIPALSWTGAAIASLVSDGLLMAFLWLAVGYLRHVESEKRLSVYSLQSTNR
jgi:O-antigen/teichoic acid export membrane protein